MFAFLGTNHGSQNLEFRPFRLSHDAGNNLVSGLGRDWVVTAGAISLPNPRVENPQKVINLRDRTNRRAWVFPRGLLRDGDRRTQARYKIDVGLRHLPEKLSGETG